MATKSGSTLSYQGGLKASATDPFSVQFDGTDTIVEIPTILEEVTSVSMCIVKPDGTQTASGQSQQLEVMAVHTPAAGTAGAISATGVITPALTSAGGKVVAIGRVVEGAGTADTDTRICGVLYGS